MIQNRWTASPIKLKTSVTMDYIYTCRLTLLQNFWLGMWTILVDWFLEEKHIYSHTHTIKISSDINWMKQWYKETDCTRFMHLIYSNTANRHCFSYPQFSRLLLTGIYIELISVITDNEEIQHQNSTRKGWLWAMNEPYSNATNSPNTLCFCLSVSNNFFKEPTCKCSDDVKSIRDTVK